jgi:hypothetical protein
MKMLKCIVCGYEKETKDNKEDGDICEECLYELTHKYE